MKQREANARARPKPHRDREEGLLYQEALFVREYLANGGNGTQAAIAAGYAAKSAARSAARLLQRPDVDVALERARARVLTALEQQAVLTIEERSRALSLAIARIVQRDRFTTPEVHALSTAVKTLTEIRGEKIENLNVTGNLGLPQILAGVHDRIRERRQQQAQEGGNA